MSCECMLVSDQNFESMFDVNVCFFLHMHAKIHHTTKSYETSWTCGKKINCNVAVLACGQSKLKVFWFSIIRIQLQMINVTSKW